MKGRFAPTPSGRMHLGNVFSFLLCWLSAKSQNGNIMLRIEDLDIYRTKSEYTIAMMKDLVWLGLIWDEGPGFGITDENHLPENIELSENAPEYFQSTRTEFYEKELLKLERLNLLYPCFCSRAELHVANAPHASDGTYVYTRKCIHLSDAQRRVKKQTTQFATRIKVPDITVATTDICQGEYTQQISQECGDFILRRRDGVFAYQFCTPLDDGIQGVTEVVRGRDLLSSTARQTWLMQTLGYTPPTYCHVPLLLAPDGRRLSKRDKDLDLGVLRQSYKTPHVIIGQLGYLAGLIPTPTPISAQDLIPFFDWKKISRKDIIIEEDTLQIK